MSLLRQRRGRSSVSLLRQLRQLRQLRPRLQQLRQLRQLQLQLQRNFVEICWVISTSAVTTLQLQLNVFDVFSIQLQIFQIKLWISLIFSSNKLIVEPWTMLLVYNTFNHSHDTCCKPVLLTLLKQVISIASFLDNFADKKTNHWKFSTKNKITWGLIQNYIFWNGLKTTLLACIKDM